jgi:hypothetical protein
MSFRRYSVAAMGVLVVLGIGAETAGALTVTIDATTFGFYRDNFQTAFSGTPFLGWNPISGGNEMRDYLVFDLTAVPGGETVVSATLQIQLHAFGYSSPDPNETVEWVAVTTPIATLTANAYVQAIFDDLGDGTSYGTRVFSAADDGTLSLSSLNGSAVAALNAALSGSFAIGGHLTSINTSSSHQQSVFINHVAGYLVRLELITVPEPGTFLLLGAGLSLLGSHRRLR